MADIKRLLNKKGWTGRELGILELTNMAVMFKQALEGKEPQPIIAAGQFQKMINGITDRTQGQIYNGYISIHEWLSLKYNIAQTQLQQAQLQFRTLESFISQAIFAEDVYSYVEQLPAIMTQKQFEETRAARIKAYLEDENGEELYSNVFNLVDRFIDYYIRLLQREPKKANPLKAIRKKYISQPVKSKLILSRYNEVTGEGYYTLEDGRRSDEMTAEEWQDAIITPKMKEALKTMKAGDGEGTVYTQAIASMRLIERAKVIFEGGTEEDADKAQHKADYERGLTIPAKWHYYEAPPENITKWDIIEQELLLEFYPADIDGSGDEYSESNFTASMEDFVAEFKELVAVALSEIDHSFFKDSKGLSELPISEWGTTLFGYKQLYEKDFYSMRAEAEADTTIFDGDKRALFNGIAILRASDLLDKSPRIDERGYYTEPEIRHALSSFSLEAFFPEAEEYADNIEIVDNARETLLDSYYFLMGYNYTLDMIARFYDVSELGIFKADLAGLADKIDELNELVPILYMRIKNTDYRDKELQAGKLQVLKDIFPPIEYKALTIPAENTAEAEELLEDFKAFKPENADRFYNLLCIRPKAGEEDERGLE